MGVATGQSAARQNVLTGSIGSIQRRFALTLSWVLLILPWFGAVAQAAAGADIFSPRQLALNLGTSLVGLVALLLVRQGRINAAGVIAAFILLAAALFISQNEIRLLLVVLGVIVAATLTTTPFFIVATVIATVPFFRTLLEVIQETGISPTDRGIEAVGGIGVTVVVAIVFRYLFDITQRTTVTAERSFRRLVSVADIGRQTSRLTALETLLQNTVNTIQEQFGFYHVQIFLVDGKREFANLVASTGNAGRELLARNHRLGVGSQSVIGRVTLSNEFVLINDTRNEPGHAFNALLPETRAELALPMQVAGDAGEQRVIGALDVQSVEAGAFSDTDVQALQALANQLAVTIRNAQLFAAQESSVRENQELAKRAQESLGEIQRLNRELTRQAWEDALSAQPEVTGIRIVGDEVTYNPGWTPAMIDAYHSGTVVTRRTPDGDLLTATPIKLRDATLGAIEIIGGDNTEIDLIYAIIGFTERLVAALELVRLIEEAQATSAQQQRINTVISRFQEAETVDELLQISLTELAETLAADEGSIRVGLMPSGQAAR
ncbi:MAG: GAF domain-containing protein [Chloroflexi bacterium]|nr:GAF domain-containing protein [Chloroflexota bacterium]